jgi:membrane-associated protease RseP (regulator of RpoE activity)
VWQPYIYTPRVRFQHRWWLHILLLLLTIASTTLAAGPWYSATIIGILGAHEMGHYLACRYYRVDATLPFFIPFALPPGIFQTGTLGAVIRIREPFPTRKVLFDIGIAGPIAGFVVLVPLLFLGMSWSEVIPVFPTDFQIGRPLLYQFARWVTFGHIPDTHFVSLHPMVIGAWFGMLATALNLLPFGQLDGGHITYSVLRRAATPISLATVASAVVMSYFSLSWVVMTTLMIAMLFLVGTRHPPVLNDREPLGRGRYWLALFALLMLVLCFTPAPIRITLP